VASYEFLLSSLPALLYKNPAPFSQSDFFDRVVVSLTESELQELKSTTLFPDVEASSGLEVIRRWYDWEKSLSAILAKSRAAINGMNSCVPVSFAAEHSELAETVKRVLALDNPLTAEEFLDEERFNFLDTLTGSHYFDKSALFLYKLKLDLVLRRTGRVEEAGKTAFTAVYNEVLSGFDSKGKNGVNQ
jgi:hypothetical protein